MNQLAKRVHVVSTFVELGTKVRMRVAPPKIGKWLSHRFQHLGPTYIKIGQFISSRGDIFGEDFTDQFMHLRDQVIPIAKNESKEILRRLKSQHSFIQDIEEHPLASASIGQVHKAKDIKGNDILLKVRRPDIKETIRNDIAFLRFLFGVASFVSVQNIDNTITLLDEFEAFLTQEIDFNRERRNLAKFYTLYMPEFGKELLTVPRLIKCVDNGADDVIMMEYIHNTGFDAYKGDREELAKNIMRLFIRQFVQYGFLHGDPHKGNIGITDSNKIVLYDYGNIITINENERNIFKELIYMMVIGNKYGVVKLLGKLGVTVTDKEAVYEYVDRYVEYMKTIDIKVFDGLQSRNDKLPLHLSGKIIRIIRVYGILEGVCKELDPSFNYFKLLDDKLTDMVLDANFLDYKVRKDIDMFSKLQNVVFRLMEEDT